mmetsp:Transcript_97679/g.152717  ORF Transcript_97679/g.152717 Transcript_97679/m.152717 type:complete len:809 (-) Transcript_97679:147-2573(-)
MAPSPEDWEEDEEDDDDADSPYGADGIGDDYDVDRGGDDDDLESFLSDEGSSCSDSVRGHCWPDPFDIGTEASTPARSSRSPSADDTSRLSSGRLHPLDHPCGDDSDSETALHDDYAVVLSAAAEIARCADARFGLVRQQAERPFVLRIEPLPKPLLEVLHGRFSKAVASPPSSAKGQSGAESSFRGDFRSIPAQAWQSLYSDFHRPRQPEAVLFASGSGLTIAALDLDITQKDHSRSDGDLDIFPVAPTPVVQSAVQATAEAFPNVEAVLRARMDAKQVLMSVVLKSIFAMQLSEQASVASLAEKAPEMQARSMNGDCPENVEIDDLSRGQDEKSNEACRRTSSKERAARSSTSSRGRKLILAPRDRLRTQPTRPRQPPPRPEKKPLVPRAPRLSTPSSKASTPSRVDRAASSPTSSAADSDEVCGERHLEPVCYEVSDEEFSRLLHAGALQGVCEHDGETCEVALDEAYEVSDEEFERLLQAGVLSMAAQEDASTIPCCKLASPRQQGLPDSCTSRVETRDLQQQRSAPRPPPTAHTRDAPQIRRRSEPHASDQPSNPIGRQPRRPPKSAPPKPLGSKPAPKRIGKVGCDSSMASACRGGLFFLPTDGVPAVSSRAAPRGAIASSSSQDDEDALGEAMFTGADDMEFRDFMDSYRTVHQAAAGSPLHSARLLRERAAPRSVPSRWEDPPPPLMQRRAPLAPAVASFKSPGSLPRIDLRNTTAPASSGASFSELGFENFSSGASSSAHCDFRDDCRGFVPCDEDMPECRSLPARSPASGREFVWDSGVMPFYGSHGRRVPRKLAPLP